MRTKILFCAVVLTIAFSAAGRGDEAPLDDILQRGWAFRLQESPLLATSVGEHSFNDRLADVSRPAHLRRAEFWKAILAELDRVNRDQLSADDRTNYDVFRRQVEDEIATVHFGGFEIPFNADSGFHSGIASLPNRVPLNNTADYENYLARLAAIPGYFDQHIANMRAGLARGMTQPAEVLHGIAESASAHAVDDPEESVFFAPFKSFPVGVPQSDRDALKAQGRAVIADAVAPAYGGLATFFADEYLPGTRATGGASNLPDGAAYYQQRIRYYTTLDLSAEEIHQIGLDEVARIRGEMNEVIDEVGFEGTFDEFLEFLRTDPRFYAESAEELLKQAAYLSKKMDGQLPALFGKLPRLPYGIEPVPEHIAPKYTAGRYISAPEGSTRPGYYWVNTYALDTRSLYNLEALTLHEAVPGHHLQISLASEIEDVPPFRKYEYISAFGEGWGLYSERLGLEAGFYTDPYSNFGRLTYEMWRACRLVVDTGVHAFGWTRDRVKDFLASNTALSLHEVETETDRYISWPAQALSYKLGELEIRRLRAEAEEALGTDFDIREFHDVVLSQGSVPLGTLRSMVEAYIVEKVGGASG